MYLRPRDFVIGFHEPCLYLRRFLGIPLATLPPFFNSQVYCAWPNVPSSDLLSDLAGIFETS
jgi:hypothetical protein